MNQPEVIYKNDWVLINAYFYKFWIKLEEFKKFKINNI